MKVVAFLQNMWFRDPERSQKLLEMYESREADGRERFVRDFIFFGCLTGRRLLTAFGDEMRWSIVWEEASRAIHGHSSAAPPADPQHMNAVMLKHQPAVVLLFGKIAQSGYVLCEYRHRILPVHIIALPHPAARGGNVISELAAGAKRLREILTKETT
jgi:hypothetical protein